MDMSTSSSQVLVLDQEELLTLILLRLPYRKIMSLKCVSKKWRYLITTPHFTRLLRDAFPPLRASALLMQQHRPSDDNPDEGVYLVSLDDQNTPTPFSPHNSQKFRIMQSCNGLLLCSTSDRYCCVYNLSTNHLATIPIHPDLGYGFQGHDYLYLSYDPLKSLHYKVIALVHTSQPHDVGNFHIYSSETGTWKASIRVSLQDLRLDFYNGVYWNGCVHWLSDSYCFYFNVDEARLKTLPRPPSAGWWSRRSLWFGESEDHLHVIEVCPPDTSLSVYEMKSDYSEWFVKYQIDLDSISKEFPEMKNDYSERGENNYSVAVLSVIRREKFGEDSFLVLSIPGKVIRYNLVNRTSKLISDFGVTLNLKSLYDGAPESFQVCQYSESLS